MRAFVCHLISAVAAAANEASSSEERSRAISRENGGTSVKASAVNTHDYKRRIVRYKSGAQRIKGRCYQA